MMECPFDILTDDENGLVRAWKDQEGNYNWIEVRPKNSPGLYLRAKRK